MLHPQVTKQLGIDNRDVINVEFPTFNVTASLAVKIIDGLSDLTINGTLQLDGVTPKFLKSKLRGSEAQN